MNEKVANATSESFFARAKGYFSESADELKKVHAPTRQEAMKLTGVVVLIIAFISVCLFVMDLSFNWLMGKMLSR
jgi:preprotein translocase SecE subunit